MGGFKDLNVYQKAYTLAMEIYTVTKGFPKEEIYSLTCQIRRSSRAVCSNLAEGYRKRQYPAYFVNKVSDADMENSETFVWIDFALDCGYLTKGKSLQLKNQGEEIGKILFHMINHPEKYLDHNKQS